MSDLRVTNKGKLIPPDGMRMVSAEKIEVFKVWYATFLVLMDTEPEETLVPKLRGLRESLRKVVPE